MGQTLTTDVAVFQGWVLAVAIAWHQQSRSLEGHDVPFPVDLPVGVTSIALKDRVDDARPSEYTSALGALGFACLFFL